MGPKLRGRRWPPTLMNPQVAKLRCSQDPATFPPSVVAAHGTARQPVLPVGSVLPLLIRCFDSTGCLPKQVHGGILLDVKKARYTMGESLQEGHQKKARCFRNSGQSF
ncbi:uncharacterized protein LOC101780637 isoform X1 [Setaria italica]|uniref:uncharacterized protein LOC101780637 isoform X1 n=1 Tax=Setaria italica TaxID=4555 RepID=UPI000BE54A25|nr:uncharacterized protein LOC101780637 isoform X1 [Setaria italica]